MTSLVPYPRPTNSEHGYFKSCADEFPFFRSQQRYCSSGIDTALKVTYVQNAGTGAFLELGDHAINQI